MNVAASQGHSDSNSPADINRCSLGSVRARGEFLRQDWFPDRIALNGALAPHIGFDGFVQTLVVLAHEHRITSVLSAFSSS